MLISALSIRLYHQIACRLRCSVTFYRGGGNRQKGNLLSEVSIEITKHAGGSPDNEAI